MRRLGRFCLEIGEFRIEHDRDYGCNKRTGWSVSFDGSYLVQLHRSFWYALVSSCWRRWKNRKEWREARGP